MNHRCWPIGIVTIRAQDPRECQALSASPDNHHRFSCRCDSADAGAYTVARYLLENSEGRKGLQVVATCFFREPNDSGAAVASAARWIKRHVSVASTGREDEEVNSAGALNFFVEGLRIPEIGKPDRLGMDTISRRERFVEWSGNFFPHKVMARPKLVIRGAFKAVLSFYEVFIHHHQHEMADVLACLCQSPRHRAVSRARSAAGWASEKKTRARHARVLDSFEDTLGKLLPDRVWRWKDAQRCPVHRSLCERVEEQTCRADHPVPSLERRANDSGGIPKFGARVLSVASSHRVE